MGSPSAVAFAVVLLGGAAALLYLCARAVGNLADAAGEDRRWWQLAMLPFGIFGPFMAKVFLDRRGGGPGRPA